MDDFWWGCGRWVLSVWWGKEEYKYLCYVRDRVINLGFKYKVFFLGVYNLVEEIDREIKICNKF